MSGRHPGDDLLFEHVRPGATPAREVEAHVATCESCRAEAERLRTALRALATATPPPLAGEGIDALITGALAPPAPVPVRRTFPRRLLLLAAAIALASTAAWAGWALSQALHERRERGGVASPLPSETPPVATPPLIAPADTPPLRVPATPLVEIPAAPSPSPLATSEPPPPEAEESAESLYARAESELAAGRGAEAALLFEALAARFPSSPSAPLALFEAARLHETVSRNLAAAAENYRRCLAASPGSPLAADALRGLCRTSPPDPACGGQ